MAAVLSFLTDELAGSLPAATYYFTLFSCDNLMNSLVEANAQITYRTAGVMSRFVVVVWQNDIPATSTGRIRKNTANGSSVVSVTASSTGTFRDTTNTDSITAGDLMAYSMTGGVGGTQILNHFGHQFTATTNTVNRMGTQSNSGDYSSASTTYFEAMNGFVTAANTSETTGAKMNYPGAGTAKNFFINIATNARSTDTTVRNRINGANGTGVVTCTALTTGSFEDTTHSDAVAADDDLNWSVTTGTGVGSFIINTGAFDFESTTSAFIMGQGVADGTLIGTGFDMFMGTYQCTYNYNTTEGNTQVAADMSMTASKLSVLVSTNTVTSASTAWLRVGGANSALTVSITASTTGQFQDSTHSVALVAANLINYRILTGATGADFNCPNILALYTVAAAAPTVSPYPTLLFMHVG